MDVSTISNLGTGGFAILVMWWMYQSAQTERNAHFDAFRDLESDIRNKLSGQLMENTNALNEHSKIMGNVLSLLEKLNNK